VVVISNLGVTRGGRLGQFSFSIVNRVNSPDCSPRFSPWCTEGERIEQGHHAGRGRIVGIDPRIARRRFELRGAHGALHMQGVIHSQRLMTYRALDVQGFGLVQNASV